MHDIADRLATDIEIAAAGAPPAPSGVDDLLRQGRRGVVRRRAALGAGATAAALVVGGATWALLPGGAGAGTDTTPVASGPEAGSPDDVARYDESGTLVVAEGWAIERRVEDPLTGRIRSEDFPADEVDDSVALVVGDGRQTRWVIAWLDRLDDDPDDAVVSGTATGVPGEDADSFADFVSETVDLMLADFDPWVADAKAYLDDVTGELRVAPGWSVAERVDDPLDAGSLAVDVTDGRRHQWFLWDGSGGEVSDITSGKAHPNSPDPAYRSFTAWVDDMVATIAAHPRSEGER